MKCSFIQFSAVQCSAVQCSAVDNKLEVSLVDYADTELEYSDNDYGIGYLFFFLFVSSSKKEEKNRTGSYNKLKNHIFFLLWIIVKQNMTRKYVQENFLSFQNYKQGDQYNFTTYKIYCLVSCALGYSCFGPGITIMRPF